MGLRKEFKKTKERVDKIANIINSTQAYVMYTNGFVLGGSSGGGGGGEPAAYIKSVNLDTTNQIVFTKKDGTTQTFTVDLDDIALSGTTNIESAVVSGDFTLDKGAHFTAGSGAEVNVECEFTCSDIVDFSTIKDIDYPCLTLTEATAGTRAGIVTYADWSTIYNNKAYTVKFGNQVYYYRDTATNEITFEGVRGTIVITYQAPIAPETSPTITWVLYEDVVVISAPTSATSGTLTDLQLMRLQYSDNCYILLNNEKYYLSDKEHASGVLGYTHCGYENNARVYKNISITISTKGWVLRTDSLYQHTINISTSTSNYNFMLFLTNNTPITNSNLGSILTNYGNTFLLGNGFQFDSGTAAPTSVVTQIYNNATTSILKFSFSDGITEEGIYYAGTLSLNLRDDIIQLR